MCPGDSGICSSNLCSLGQGQDPGSGWSWDRERFRMDFRERFFHQRVPRLPKEWGEPVPGRFRMDFRAPRGCRALPRLYREWAQPWGCQSSRSCSQRCPGWDFRVSVQGQELTWMILMGPSQLRSFHNPKNYIPGRDWQKISTFSLRPVTRCHSLVVSGGWPSDQ